MIILITIIDLVVSSLNTAMNPKIKYKYLKFTIGLINQKWDIKFVHS